MKSVLAASAFLVACASCAAVAKDAASGANSADPTPAPTWTGLYFGATIGSEFDATRVSDPFGASIFGDEIRAPGFAYGVRGGYNWQPRGTNWVFGAEADVEGLDAVGNNTCFAFSGDYLPSNCAVHPRVMGALTARAGYSLGRTLIYAKGGAALLDQSISETENGSGPFANSAASNHTAFGWTLGAGVEYALTNAWSLTAEYDYARFADGALFAPLNLATDIWPHGPPHYLPVSSATAGATSGLNEFKLGLNYNLDADLPGSTESPFARGTGGWGFEFGGRDWLSTGRFQKGLIQPSLVSQLTYANVAGNSGEAFGRLDSPVGVFLKGLVGLGELDQGRMNDEDFNIPVQSDLPGKGGQGGGQPPLPIAYSNTLSGVDSSSLSYATVDLGYDFASGPGYRLGAFAGYNLYHDQMKAYGCSQIANPKSDCAPALPASTLGIVETDAWQSLRVGADGEVALTDQLKLDVDAAYLPHVSLSGTDQHVLRDLFIRESGEGRGAQIESILSYQMNDRWSVGAGARSWTAWTNKGSYTQEGATNPAQYRTERYGVFLQTSYKLGG